MCGGWGGCGDGAEGAATLAAEAEARRMGSFTMGAAQVEARAAGVPVVLVPDGYTGAPAVSLGADYVVGSLADIPGSILPQPPIKRSA